jgi:GNAT superfamily N-acetyltransferase
LALRQAVLGVPGADRPLVMPGDDEPTTVAFAAIDLAGEVLSVVRVSKEAPPFSTEGICPAGTPSYRIRGMATRPEARNRGVGSAVLSAAIDHVGDQGGGLLWCNARIPAVSLYERAGFATRGQAWVDPTYGGHIVMWRQVLDR